MRRHLINAACGVADYAAYPLAMLFVAPYTLHKLGTAEFGLWMIAGAIISTGGIIASGFSEANLQRVACLHQSDDLSSIRNSAATMLTVNLATGFLVALCVFLVAPWAATKVEAHRIASIGEATLCFRIAAGCIPLRAVHAVAVSTQRALQDFRASTRITTTTHLLTLGIAAAATSMGHGTITILIATTACLLVATCAQCREVTKILGPQAMRPIVHRDSLSALLSGGVYVWLQTVGGVLADRIDRLLLGLTVGAAAVAPYILCVQLAQPIIGLSGSALCFLMPHLAGKFITASRSSMRRTIAKTIIVNFIIVTCGTVLLLAFGSSFLHSWIGGIPGAASRLLLPKIVIGSGLLALSVSGTYILQALGKFRMLATISLGSRLLLLPVMIWLLRHAGASGLASFRLLSGAVALTIYVPVLLYMRSSKPLAVQRSVAAVAQGART